MAPGTLADLPADLRLLDASHRHGPVLSIAVLFRQPAGTVFRAQKFPSVSSYCLAEAFG
jgi:hypothetical protein